MIQIYICVGSSCHINGSYNIITQFQQLIKKYNLEQRVEIKASFCLGHCSKYVSMKVDDEFIDELLPDNVEEIFCKYVLERVNDNGNNPI